MNAAKSKQIMAVLLCLAVAFSMMMMTCSNVCADTDPTVAEPAQNQNNEQDATAESQPSDEQEQEQKPVFKNGKITVNTFSELCEAVQGNKKKTVIIGKDMTIGSHGIPVGNNTTLIATGRTLKCPEGAIRIPGTKSNYGSFDNVKITGGTWVSKYDRSLFQFVHGRNLTMNKMKITCGITGHAIELIACKNVKILNCNVKGIGKAKKDCLEEQIQIDIATPRTAPTVANKLRKGQTCTNVTIDHCTVTGARAVCANYASAEKKYKSKFHSNIKVTNCKLTGTKSEALALFNALNVTVKKNTIKTKAPLSRGPYSVGCHIHMFGKVKGVKVKNRKVTIVGNNVYGGREAILIYSHSSSKYGKAIVRKNKAHCKNGGSNAIKVDGVSSKSVKSNKQSKW